MNRTTLSLFSGPLQDPRRREDVWSRFDGDALDATPVQRSELTRRSGWLLTGDAVLRDRDVLDRFCAFFGEPKTNYLGRTEVLTAPHHGSKANLNAESLLRLGVPPVAVIPASDGKYYGHPSDEVMTTFRDHGAAIAHVHEQCTRGLVNLISL